MPKMMLTRAALSLGAFAAIGQPVPAAVGDESSAAPQRSVAQTVRSSALPRITVEIDPSFVYLGRGAARAMEDSAEFERFVFGEVREGRLVRAAIVHFERFLPGREGAFNYPSFRMVRLGGEEYLHQIFPIADGDFWQRPDLAALLSTRGITAGNSWLMGRYVRAVGPDRRHEVIVSYLEAEDLVGRNMAELEPLMPPNNVAHPAAQDLERAFIERQNRAVRITE